MQRRLLHDRGLLALALLVAASTTVRYALSLGFDAPWISPDEEIYALLGRSLWETGSFTILGEPAPYYSALYPALVGLPLALLDTGAALEVVQLLQAGVMSAVAIPVYLWGRSFLPRGWALAAAGLSLALPALAYTGLVMSETLFLPVSVTAVWALTRALARPTLGRQLLFAGIAAAAVATRLQAIVLVPVFVLAALLLAVFSREAALMRRFLPALSGIGAVAALWVAVTIAREGSWSELLGAYATVGEQGYSAPEAARYVAWHVADVFLVVVGAPLLALLVLAIPAFAGREESTLVRAFVAASLAYSLLLTVEVGVFASRFVGHFAERQLVSAAPPLFLAMALWLHRGAPRPQPWTSIAVALVAAPVLLLPVDELATPIAAPDALMTIPLEQLAAATSATTLEAVYLAGAAAAIVLFVALPRRATPVLAVVVAAGLVGASGVAAAEVKRLSERERVRVFGAGEPRWVDGAADGGVTLFWLEPRAWTGVWQQLFWNERIDHVVRPPELVVPGPLAQTAAVPRFDGRLYADDGVAIDPRLVAAPRDVRFAGEPLAVLPPTPDLPETVLWRIEQPAHLTQWATGFQPNGDLLGIARVSVYSCGPGRLELTLLGKEGKPLRISRDGTPLLERVVRDGEIWRASIPAPPDAHGATRCIYELESEGLIGSTRVDFVRD